MQTRLAPALCYVWTPVTQRASLGPCGFGIPPKVQPLMGYEEQACKPALLKVALPCSEEERLRIEAKNPNPKMPLVRYVGGTWRVGGILALSRAFGDAYMKSSLQFEGLRASSDGYSSGFGVIAEPDTSLTDLTGAAVAGYQSVASPIQQDLPQSKVVAVRDHLTGIALRYPLKHAWAWQVRVHTSGLPERLSCLAKVCCCQNVLFRLAWSGC